MSKPHYIPSIAHYMYKGYLPGYPPHPWEKVPGTQWGCCAEQHTVTGEVRHRNMQKTMCGAGGHPGEAHWAGVAFSEGQSC